MEAKANANANKSLVVLVYSSPFFYTLVYSLALLLLALLFARLLPSATNNYNYNSQPQGVSDITSGGGATPANREIYKSGNVRVDGTSDSKFVVNGKYLENVKIKEPSRNQDVNGQDVNSMP